MRFLFCHFLHSSLFTFSSFFRFLLVTPNFPLVFGRLFGIYGNPVEDEDFEGGKVRSEKEVFEDVRRYRIASKIQSFDIRIRHDELLASAYVVPA